MEDSIELRLIGITYNQIESGVYALILEDPVDKRRLAIVIGYPEAQSIECHLQKVKTPRPLAHDLMVSMLSALDAKLLRIDIHRLPTGPYAGRMTLVNLFGEKKEIDARSSDAIALAIRTGAPIYTTRELLDTKGYTPQKEVITTRSAIIKTKPKSEWTKYSETQLEELIARYVNEENYEAAAQVKEELERRRNKG